MRQFLNGSCQCPQWVESGHSVYCRQAGSADFAKSLGKFWFSGFSLARAGAREKICVSGLSAVSRRCPLLPFWKTGPPLPVPPALALSCLAAPLGTEPLGWHASTRVGVEQLPAMLTAVGGRPLNCGYVKFRSVSVSDAGGAAILPTPAPYSGVFLAFKRYLEIFPSPLVPYPSIKVIHAASPRS